MRIETGTALAQLLGAGGLSPDIAKVDFTGGESTIASPHRLAQSATGICVDEGGADAPRVVPCTLLADYLTSYLGTFGALAGLIRRARDGGSYHVRISLAQTCVWVQDLGRSDGAATTAPEGGAAPRILRMDSPFGELEYLAPVAQFSATPAYWDKPPVPLGASRAEWLPGSPA